VLERLGGKDDVDDGVLHRPSVPLEVLGVRHVVAERLAGVGDVDRPVTGVGGQ